MKKFVIVLMAMALVASMAAAEKPQLEKPVMSKGDRADFTHFEGGDLCSEEAEYNVIAGDGLSYEGDLQANEEIDWFELFITADGNYTIETLPGADELLTTDDTRVYLYEGDCGTDTLVELAFNDDGGEGYFSLLAGQSLTAGSYYIAVTLYPYSTPHPGTFTLVVTQDDPPPPPPVNDTCEGALPLPMGETFEFDMCGATADYNDGAYGDSCTGWSTNGLDVVYYVDLVTDQQLTINAASTYDISFYVVTDCADIAGTCVIGDDSAESTIVFDAADAPGRYYVIFDGYSSTPSCDIWTVTVDGVVATEGTSFGNLKAMYR